MKKNLVILLLFMASKQALCQTVKKDLVLADSVILTVQHTTLTKDVTQVCVHISNYTKALEKQWSADTVCILRNSPGYLLFKQTLNQAVNKLFKGQPKLDLGKMMEAELAARYEEIIKSSDEKSFFEANIHYDGLSAEEIRKVKSDLKILEETYDNKKKLQDEERLKNAGNGGGQKDEEEEDYDAYAKKQIAKESRDKRGINAKDTTSQSELELKKLENKIKYYKTSINRLFAKRRYSVSLIGNANMVSSFKTVDKTQLNAGFGVLAYRKGSSNNFGPFGTEFLGVITVAQSNDTIKSATVNDFGQSVLVPGVRRFSLLTSYRQTSISPLSSSSFFRKVGIALNVNVTPYQWVLPSQNNAEDSVSAKIIPASFDLMFPFNWLYIADAQQDIYIATDIGLTMKYLGGNSTGDTRTKFLGHSKQVYAGIIAGLTFRYNGLRAQFHCPLLFGNHVDGLTNGQAYASIGFVTDIIGDIKSILSSKKQNNDDQ